MSTFKGLALPFPSNWQLKIGFAAKRLETEIELPLLWLLIIQPHLLSFLNYILKITKNAALDLP
ncbi:hypothetical protein GAPWKB11_1113 [Gilliamella apicola]|nr:hypothetical protein GAPWKB11_1113 [Gilliamella apicola]